MRPRAASWWLISYTLPPQLCQLIFSRMSLDIGEQRAFALGFEPLKIVHGRCGQVADSVHTRGKQTPRRPWRRLSTDQRPKAESPSVTFPRSPKRSGWSVILGVLFRDGCVSPSPGTASRKVNWSSSASNPPRRYRRILFDSVRSTLKIANMSRCMTRRQLRMSSSLSPELRRVCMYSRSRVCDCPGERSRISVIESHLISSPLSRRLKTELFQKKESQRPSAGPSGAAKAEPPSAGAQPRQPKIPMWTRSF